MHIHLQVNVGTHSISECLAPEGVVGLCICLCPCFLQTACESFELSDRCERFIACLIASCV